MLKLKMIRAVALMVMVTMMTNVQAQTIEPSNNLIYPPTEKSSSATSQQYDLTFGPTTQSFGYIQAYHPMDFEEIPLSQITPVNASTPARQYYNFGVLAMNSGGQTIPMTANPRVIYDVQYNNSGTWVSQLLDSIPFNHDILAGDTATLNGVDSYNKIIPLPLSGFQPTQVGQYRIVYTLTSDLPDVNPSNNVQTRKFKITDDTWYSVTTRNANGELVSDGHISQATISGAEDAFEFETGNVYYVPSGDGLYIDSVQYLLQASSGFNTNYSGSYFIVGVRVYKWTTDMDYNLDGKAQLSEYLFTSQAVDTVNLVGAGLYPRKVAMPDPYIMDSLTGAMNHPYRLEDDALYFVTVYQSIYMQGMPLGGDGDLMDEAGGYPNSFMVRTNKVTNQGFSAFGYGTSATSLLANGGFTEGIGEGEMITGFFNQADFAPAIALKLSDCATVSRTEVKYACGSYTWIDGNTYTTSNNTATYAIAGGAANGCDSVIRLDLTVGSIPGTDTQEACESYTWIDGNTYTTSNNTATYTITGGAAAGCDSVVTLNLIINDLDLVVFNSGGTLTSNEADTGTTYQWIDCTNGNTPIVGATNRTFTPSTTGNYAVILTGNGCTDTTVCMGVLVSDVSTLEDTENNITIYPNPNQGSVHLNLGTTNTATIRISNALGQVIKTQELTSSISTINIDGNTGIYFLEVNTEKGRQIFKLIKE